MSILDPRLWLACIGAMALAFVAGYITKGKHVKDAQTSAQLKQVKTDVKKHNEATKQLETKRDERSNAFRSISDKARQVNNGAGSNPVCFDFIRVQLANEALSGGIAAKSDKAMPDTKSVK